MTEQEQVTLVCSEPGCDFTVTANATGKSFATFKLGSHRANRHGYRKGKTPRAPAAQQGAEDGERPIPVQVLAGMAEEFTPGKTSPPTQDEMTRALAHGLYTISYATAATMVETDPTLRGARRGKRPLDPLAVVSPGKPRCVGADRQGGHRLQDQPKGRAGDRRQY